MERCKEFFETTIHDIKSPLTIIKGTVDFINYDLDNSINKNDLKEAIKIIKRNTKNIECMVNTLLTSSMIDSKEAIIEPKPISNLSYLLREYSKNFKYKMKSKDIKFKTYIQKNLPTVNIDFAKVKNHILNNIITNAIKFTPKNGTIKISAFEDEKDVIVVVEDSGKGIAVRDRKKVFEKRTKLKNNLSTKGFGLGLYNAMFYAKKHNGIISVSNSIFNSGCAFTVRFPKESLVV